MPIFSDAVTATQSTINQGPLNGPEINANGSRAVTYWDPSPPGVDSNGNAVLYGFGPLYSENPWDLVTLAGNRLPGICTIKCEPQLQIDQQKGPKHDGSILTIHGILPCPVEVTVKVWTQEQWEKLSELIPTFWRKPLKDPASIKATAAKFKVSDREAAVIQQASAIAHPGLVPFNITQVVVKGVSLPEDGPEPQSKIIRIRCIEFQPATKKTSPSKVKKPKDAAADGRVVKDPPPSQTHVGPNGLSSQ